MENKLITPEQIESLDKLGFALKTTYKAQFRGKFKQIKGK